MAKVTGPLFSMTASGKLANAIVFMSWRGIQDVRMYKKPTNNRTPNQIITRAFFSTAVTNYHALSTADQEALRASAAGKPYSGFNLFMDWCKTWLDAGKDWVKVYDVSASAVLTTSVDINVTDSKGGKCVVKYGMNPGVYTDQTPAEAGNSTANTTRAIAITGLTLGTKYYYTVEFTLTTTFWGRTGEYNFTTALT